MNPSPDVGQPIQAADPLSSGSSRLESRLQARLPAPQGCQFLRKTDTKMRILIPMFLAVAAVAQVPPIEATIDAGKTGAPISKYVYGQFIEHIAGIINNGIWAEMLDDRKFYRSEERRVG